MRLHEILHIDPAEPVFLAENSFSDHAQAQVTERYLGEFEKIGGMNSIRLVDHGIPIAIAVYVHSQGIDHWLVLTNVISKDEHFSMRMSDIPDNRSEIIETDASDLREAIIEYYSIFLKNRWLCEPCAREHLPYIDVSTLVSARDWLQENLKDTPDVRNERLKHLIREIVTKRNFDLAHANTLEICCGDGSATQVLHDLGCDPICIDYDRCDICDGLNSGALRESGSIVLDVTELSSFFGREFECVFGFMLGPVQPFNEDMWSSILRESARVVRKDGLLIFTFHSEKELEFADDVLGNCGVVGETFGNDPDGGYDRWVYVGRKEDMG